MRLDASHRHSLAGTAPYLLMLTRLLFLANKDLEDEYAF
jgi:hypothetical protein